MGGAGGHDDNRADSYRGRGSNGHERTEMLEVPEVPEVP
jgi:hypothetical protein